MYSVLTIEENFYLCETFEIFVYLEFRQFLIFQRAILPKWQEIMTIFFVTFIQDNVFFILEEFESDVSG